MLQPKALVAAITAITGWQYSSERVLAVSLALSLVSTTAEAYVAWTVVTAVIILPIPLNRCPWTTMTMICLSTTVTMVGDKGLVMAAAMPAIRRRREIPRLPGAVQDPLVLVLVLPVMMMIVSSIPRAA